MYDEGGGRKREDEQEERERETKRERERKMEREREREREREMKRNSLDTVSIPDGSEDVNPVSGFDNEFRNVGNGRKEGKKEEKEERERKMVCSLSLSSFFFLSSLFLFSSFSFCRKRGRSYVNHCRPCVS